MELNLKKIFYVYVYLDPRKPGLFKYGEYEFDHEPFYVGKGHGKRCRQFTSGKNMYVKNKIKKIKEETKCCPIVIKLCVNVFEEEAFDFEKFLITVIGKKVVKKGPLNNSSNGGGGDSGWILSKECREERSRISRRMWADPNSRVNSAEFRKQRTEINLKRWQDSNSGFHSSERRKKIVEANRKAWADPNHYINSAGYRKKLSNRTRRYWKDPNNKIHSEECKKKRNASIKKAWAKTGTREKSGRSLKNRWADPSSGYNSEQCRTKMANAKAIEWIVIRPDGIAIRIFNLRKFCRENDLSATVMCRIAKRKPHHHQHKGWKCQYVSGVSQ